ncbi:MAG: hypothetical protein EOO20_17930 [Chryseobacterium sp.]|nr:MAG: hypothetical protein EOO20_17930 [Chryseobacterium sp.]
MNKFINPGPFTRSFQDLEEEAQYHQLLMIIQLLHISNAEFEKISNDQISLENYQHAGTFNHELTHFIDHISTLHGQKNLVLQFNAINAWANGNEREFWRIKLLFDKIKRDSFTDYFTEINQPHQGSFAEPWTFKVTSGMRFDSLGHLQDELPLLFLRFFDQSGNPLARTPISVAALHETNAVLADFESRLNFIESIQDPKLKADELAEVNRDIEDMLYSTDYCLYSAAAHLTAKTNDLVEFIDIYTITSQIGTLSLNLSEDHIKAMKQKPFFEPEWQRRFNSLTENADIGYCYYRLNENLIDDFGKANYSIDNVLAASSLPDRKALELEIMGAMIFNMSDLIDGPFKTHATLLLNYGMRLFSKRGLDGSKPGFKEWVKQEKPYPTIILSDTIWNVPEKTIDECIEACIEKNLESSLEEQFKTFTYFNEKFIAFVEACGL